MAKLVSPKVEKTQISYYLIEQTDLENFADALHCMKDLDSNFKEAFDQIKEIIEKSDILVQKVYKTLPQNQKLTEEGAPTEN